MKKTVLFIAVLLLLAVITVIFVRPAIVNFLDERQTKLDNIEEAQERWEYAKETEDYQSLCWFEVSLAFLDLTLKDVGISEEEFASFKQTVDIKKAVSDWDKVKKSKDHFSLFSLKRHLEEAGLTFEDINISQEEKESVERQCQIQHVKEELEFVKKCPDGFYLWKANNVLERYGLTLKDVGVSDDEIRQLQEMVLEREREGIFGIDFK